MRDIFVISDTHFGHANIIKYCSRPFSSVEEMNEQLVDNWNKVVKTNDIVYHLGDVYFGENGKVLERLKGRKRLILGNHDVGKDKYLQNNFQKIVVWRMFPEFGLLLTHVPVHESALEIKQLHNVHGHIHEKVLKDHRYINVSVEQINYTPISVEEIRA